VTVQQLTYCLGLLLLTILLSYLWDYFSRPKCVKGGRCEFKLFQHKIEHYHDSGIRINYKYSKKYKCLKCGKIKEN